MSSPGKNGKPTGPGFVSRRGLLLGATATGAVVAVGMTPQAQWRLRQWLKEPPEIPFDPNVYLDIAPDDTVTLIVKHLEMGQGVMTGLATIVAEELGADWSQMRATLAPGDQVHFSNLYFRRQETVASSSIGNSWDQMRYIGAAARMMLIAAAAEQWGVPAREITVEAGRIHHTASGQVSGFGALAEAAMAVPVPERDALELKPRAEWQLIGQSLPRLDTPEKTDGTAVFAIDVRRPNMLRTVIARPPRFGATLTSFDATEARKVPGVVEVLQTPIGIAVLAEDSWAAIKGRAALAADWNNDAAEMRSSNDILSDYKTMAEDPGVVALERGDTSSKLTEAAQTLDFEYSFPYLAHAPMEPLTCVMERTGPGVTIWAGCQAHTIEQRAVAKILGIAEDQVTINTTYAGASFGRRTNPRTDWITELAHVIHLTDQDRPVQLLWTREDDLRGGAYRPLAYHRGQVGLDAAGRISGWHHRIVAQSLVVGTPWSYRKAREGTDRATVGGIVETSYNLPDIRVEAHSPVSPVPVCFWRSVGDGHNGFVLENLMDELAHMAGRDPLEFRLAHLEGDARQRHVLQEAARLSGWGSDPGAGRGRGIASIFDDIRDKRTYVAIAAEVTAADDGISVDRVVAAVDCGLVINPSIVISQIEGSIGFALSTVLGNEITLDKGRVVQSNFHDYEPARMMDMPEIEVHLIPSDEVASGVGEAAVAPLAPAVANAFFAATGRRARSLPLRTG